MMVLLGLRHWNHAAVRHFAHRVLELDRRMVDAEVVQQTLFHLAQMHSLTDGGMSAIEMWQESAWISDPMLQT